MPMDGRNTACPVEDIRFSFAYAGAMGEMKRQNAREEEARLQDRFASTIVIAAAIICAVRLARDDIGRPPLASSPRSPTA
jgi:hypothetical protein